MFEIDPTSGVLSSLSVVLLQEMERFNNLLDVMGKSLKLLQQAIRGEVVMSLELDSMYSSLINNKVPNAWSSAGYLSLKPLGSWLKDCTARISFMREWLEGGQPNRLVGFVFLLLCAPHRCVGLL